MASKLLNGHLTLPFIVNFSTEIACEQENCMASKLLSGHLTLPFVFNPATEIACEEEKCACWKFRGQKSDCVVEGHYNMLCRIVYGYYSPRTFTQHTSAGAHCVVLHKFQADFSVGSFSQWNAGLM
ncbi:hypothetical protein BaRGS_00021893 [Batillaria attramentaria]|uniref:Uncharacterized protein n=1 Tax=Batillaria attramentaria TaxID=370345 RepID=A0ABD0KIW6_9CAEN